MSQMVGLDYLGFENFRANTCTSVHKSESNSVKTDPLRYEKYYRMETHSLTKPIFSLVCVVDKADEVE